MSMSGMKQCPVTAATAVLQTGLWLVGALVAFGLNEDYPLTLSMSNVILRHIRPWTYLTSGFYHIWFIQMVPMVVATIYVGTRVEPVLGTHGLLRMLLFINVFGSILLFFVALLLFIVFREPDLFDWNWYGFTGGVLSMCLALAQQNAAANVSALPFLRLRYLPMITVTTLVIIALVGVFLEMKMLLHFGADLIPHAIMGSYLGCPWISPLGTFVYNVVKLCGYFKKRDSQLLPNVQTIQLNSDPISERRKALAMKALDEKLAALAAPSSLKDAPKTRTPFSGIVLEPVPSQHPQES